MNSLAPIVKWSTVAAVALLPLVLLFMSPGYFSGLFDSPKPPGQTLFLLVKLSGLYAIYLVSLQMILALVKPRPSAILPIKWNHKLHIVLGLFILFLIIVHVFLFLGATWQRTCAFPWEALIPKFNHGYYQQRLAAGVIAFWLSGILIVAGIRRRTKTRLPWAMIHKVAFIVFVLAIIHSISIGSETQSALARIFYAVLVIGTACASLIALYRARKMTV